MGTALPSAPVHAAAPADRDADASGDVEEARKHFRQGVALFEEEDFEGALFEFRQAYEAAPDYRLLYNMGIAQRETRDYAAAQRSLSTYLAEGGEDIDAARRQEVEAELEVLASRVGQLALSCNVEGAEILVDGESVGTTPLPDSVPLNIGSRQLEVRAEGHAPYRTTIDVVGGESTSVAAELVVIPPPARVEESPLPQDGPVPDSPRAKRLRISTWAMLGVTAGVGVGTIVTGVLALGADRDLESELDIIPADPGAIRDAEDRRDTLATATDGLVGATAGLAAITLGLGIAAIIATKKARKSGTEARFSPRGAGFGLRF
jgi:hypothetical protein